jgi:GTP-binding protein
MTTLFHSGSSVSAVLSSSNAKQVLKDLHLQINSPKEIVIVGRSNCGKSSLINALLGTKVALSSKTPGKTQQLIFHTIRAPMHVPICLVDAPGYGYAEAPIVEMNKWRDLTEIYFSKSQNLINTVLLLDCRRGLQESDFILLEMLEVHKKHSTVVLTKADCLGEKQMRDVMIKIAHETARFPRTFGTVFATSAKIGYGIRELQMYLLFAAYNNLGSMHVINK